MKIETVVSGKLDNNTYVVITESNNAVIIDPSLDYEKIDNVLSNSGASLKYIIFTHGHYDHTASAGRLRQKTGAKLVIHHRDAEMLGDGEKGLSFIFTNHPELCSADIEVDDGDFLELDELKFEFMSTPGHSNGCMLIFCKDVIFTGDTVLEGTVGRTDLYGSNDSLMIQSVRKIAALEKNYTLLCGHGKPSTLEFEKKYNPYFIEYAR